MVDDALAMNRSVIAAVLSAVALAAFAVGYLVHSQVPATTAGVPLPSASSSVPKVPR
jgi:hypothetical protein